VKTDFVSFCSCSILIALDQFCFVFSSGPAFRASLSHLDRTRLEQFDAALQRNPNDASTLFERGMLFRINCYSAAVADLSRGLELDPEQRNASVFFILGLSLFVTNRCKEALRPVRSCIKLLPAYAVKERRSAYFRLGLCHFKLQQFSAAVKAFDLCLKLDPLFQHALQMRMRSYSYLGQRESSFGCESSSSARASQFRRSALSSCDNV